MAGGFAFDFEEQLQAAAGDVEESLSETDGETVGRGRSWMESQQKGKRLKISHQLVCRHWLRGMCIKGETCDFLHIFDHSRMPICRTWKKAGCCPEYDNGLCPLRHEDNIGMAGGTSTGPSTETNVICMQYIYGYCGAGPSCTLKHISISREQRPKISLPDWYLALVVSVGGLPTMDAATQSLVARQWHSYVDALTAIPGQPPAPPRPSFADILSHQGSCMKVRSFVIKSAKIENLLTSVQRGIWATGKQNIAKFEEAYKTCDHVVFVLSANESGGWQGYAKMRSLADPALYPNVWGSFSSKLSPNYRVQWLKQCKLDFEQLGSFTNPWNENKPLKKSRDGQELPYEIAEEICIRLAQCDDEDLLTGTPLQGQKTIDHRTFFDLTPDEQLQEEIRLGLRQR